jgi:hypothetical protein
MQAGPARVQAGEADSGAAMQDKVRNVSLCVVLCAILAGCGHVKKALGPKYSCNAKAYKMWSVKYLHERHLLGPSMPMMGPSGELIFIGPDGFACAAFSDGSWSKLTRLKGAKIARKVNKTGNKGIEL